MTTNEDESQESTHDKQGDVDRAVSAGEAILSLVPVAGAIAKVLGDEWRRQTSERFRHRVDDQLRQLKQRVEDAELKINSNFIQSDEFLDFSRAAFEQFSKTSRREKLDAVQNLFLHHLVSEGDHALVDTDEAILAFIDFTPASYISVFTEVVRAGGVSQHNEISRDPEKKRTLHGRTTRELFTWEDNMLLPILNYLSGQGVLTNRSTVTGFISHHYDISEWGKTVDARISDPTWARD